jgi:hypothetical protein
MAQYALIGRSFPLLCGGTDLRTGEDQKQTDHHNSQQSNVPIITTSHFDIPNWKK